MKNEKEIILLCAAVSLFLLCGSVQSYVDSGFLNYCYIDVFNYTIPDDLTDKISIWFYKPGTYKHEIIKLRDIQSLASNPNFDPNKRVIFIIHGFIETFNLPQFSATARVVRAYAYQGEFNVIGIDLHRVIGLIYIKSASSVSKAGIAVAKAAKRLLQAIGKRASYLDVLGFSLGSHIGGITGKVFQSLTGDKINRITAIDPAGPCFKSVKNSYRLNRNDAKFVEVIHTGARALGTILPLGHVDYYVNGGMFSNRIPSLLGISHLSAVYIWVKSLMIRPIVATHCNDMHEVETLTCQGNRVLVHPGSSNKRRGLYLIQGSSLSFKDVVTIEKACKTNKCNFQRWRGLQYGTKTLRKWFF